MPYMQFFSHFSGGGRGKGLALRAKMGPNFKCPYLLNGKSEPYIYGTQTAWNFKPYRMVKVSKLYEAV